MAATPAIGVPTMAGVQKSLTGYGVGILAGVGYNFVSAFTGSGLIGGAISAAATGAMVRGVLGEMIAVNLGFNVGQQGLGNLGLNGLLGGPTGNNNGDPLNGGGRELYQMEIF